MRQDHFFTQRTCDRCYKPLDGGRIMSRFNTDCICMECAHKERERSDYRKAADAEQEAVKNGVKNFSGIGLTNNEKKEK